MADTKVLDARNVNLAALDSNNKQRTLSPNSQAESVIFSDGESLQFKYNNRRLTARKPSDHVAAKVEMLRNKDTTSYCIRVKSMCAETEYTEILPIINDVSNNHLTRKEASDIFFNIFGSKFARE